MRRITLIAALAALLIPLGAAAASPGDLIKLADDGNLDTQYDSAVYYVGSDGKRYVFPNSQTYFTWYADFDGVKIVEPAEMSSYAIGGNVTYRPGTRLVKIQTDPKVYAVEPGGVLRGIGSEAVASALYGPEWNKRIDDVADTYFVNYTIGAALDAATFPTGSVVRRASDSALFYMDQGAKRRITSDAVAQGLRVQERYVLGAADLTAYSDGPDLSSAEASLIDTSGKGTGVDPSSPPTFVSVVPASSFIGVGTDANLLQLRYSAGQATTVTRITVRIDATTNKDTEYPDEDEGGLVYGNNAQPNLKLIRFLDDAGTEVFGRKEVAVNVESDQSQTFVFTGAWAVPAGTQKNLTLKAQLNTLLPKDEGYKVTLVVGGTTVLGSGGTAATFLPSSDLVGPTLTTLADKLQVQIGAAAGETRVRGADDAFVNGFTIKATTSVPNVVTRMTVQGFIDEGEGQAGFLPGQDSDNGTPTEVRQVIPRIGLYDDQGVLLGGPVDVDVNGKATFSGMSISIPAGGSKVVAIRGDISPTVFLETAPNKVSFDVMDAATDVSATDNGGTPILTSGKEPNGGVNASRYLTVRDEGELKFEWSGSGGTGIAGREVQLGILRLTPKYDDYTVQALTFIQQSGIAQSLSTLRLEWGSAQSPSSASADMIGNTASFTGLSIGLAADATVDIKLFGRIKQKDGGAVYGETVKVKFAQGGPLQWVSAANGETFEAARLGTGDFSLTANTESSAVVRYSGMAVAKSPDSPTAKLYRAVSGEVLRFTVTTEPEGAVRLKKLTFKLTPDDVGLSGADNDALEIWADANGDFADDDNVATLRQVVEGQSDPIIGEDSSAHIRYSIVSGGVLQSTSEGRNSTAGDYAHLVYEFNDGSELFVPAGTTVKYSLELMTSALATDSKDHTIAVELLRAGDLVWTDIPSGAYTARSGSEVGGSTLSTTVTVAK